MEMMLSENSTARQSAREKSHLGSRRREVRRAQSSLFSLLPPDLDLAACSPHLYRRLPGQNTPSAASTRPSSFQTPRSIIMDPPQSSSPPPSIPFDRRPSTTSLDDIVAARPPQLDHVPPPRSLNDKGPLFLGFGELQRGEGKSELNKELTSASFPLPDCSTQALKVVAIDEALQVVHETKVEFSEDLPRFRTKSGVLLGEGGVVAGPVEMYVEALDLLMERLKQR